MQCRKFNKNDERLLGIESTLESMRKKKRDLWNFSVFAESSFGLVSVKRIFGPPEIMISIERPTIVKIFFLIAENVKDITEGIQLDFGRSKPPQLSP